MEEERQKNSEDLAKTLEKLEEWKKKIIWIYKKYFLSFSPEDWKNGRREAEKFRRPSKNSGKVGRMEEVVEEENNLNL